MTVVQIHVDLNVQLRLVTLEFYTNREDDSTSVYHISLHIYELCYLQA